MQSFTIRRFLGVRNSLESSDQPRGSLRKAEGVLVTPGGALTGGPSWSALWELSDLRAGILTALTGATSNKVHFVLVTRGGLSFLVAWDMAANRDRGLFYLGGYETDPTTATGSVTYTATNSAVWREKTANLRWYGSWINGVLWLGNGTDANLVFSGGTLALLGPAAEPADSDHPGRFRFPACKQWVMTADKAIYGTGNAAAPLDVWATEKANALYPALDGLLSLDTSFVRINHTRATKITALALSGATSLAVHTDVGVVIVSGFEVGSDAYKAQQSPAEATHGALNPNCTSDADGSVNYFLARDHQLYRTSANAQGGYQKRENHTSAIATDYAGDLWNADMVASEQDDDFAVFQDRQAHLIFMLAPLATGAAGLYCYHESAGDSSAITGPIRYPDLLSVCMVTTAGRNLAVGLTRAGALVVANLTALVEADSWQLPDYNEALGSAYTVAVSQPTADPALPVVGVTPTYGAETFRQIIDGLNTGMASPWAQFSASSPAATQWFKNASISIIEVANEDFGKPDTVKEFCQVRLQFQRNNRVYVGIFAESEGRRYGHWRGTRYPKEEILSGLKLVGRRLTLRLVIVSFNDKPWLLRGLSVDFNLAVAD